MPAIQRGAQKGLGQWKLDVSSIVFDDDESLLNDDEKQFYQQMEKLSALRNAGISSGYQKVSGRSTSGGVITSHDGVLCCWVKKQRIVARSSWVGALFLSRSPLTRDRSG